MAIEEEIWSELVVGTLLIENGLSAREMSNLYSRTVMKRRKAADR